MIVFTKEFRHEISELTEAIIGVYFFRLSKISFEFSSRSFLRLFKQSDWISLQILSLNSLFEWMEPTPKSSQKNQIQSGFAISFAFIENSNKTVCWTIKNRKSVRIFLEIELNPYKYVNFRIIFFFNLYCDGNGLWNANDNLSDNPDDKISPSKPRN